MTKPERGRPVGYRKPEVLAQPIFVRPTDRQREWLSKQPGASMSEKIRRVLDAVIDRKP